MTSFNAECATYNTVGHSALEELEDYEAIDLLLRMAELKEGEYSTNELQDVTRLLGGHTLAILQAGAYIRKFRCKLSNWIEKFANERKALLERRDRRQMQSRYENVYLAFDATATALKALGEEDALDALDLLRIWSMFYFEDLNPDLFRLSWEGQKNLQKRGWLDCAPKSIEAPRRHHVERLPAFLGVGSEKWTSSRLDAAIALLETLYLAKRNLEKRDYSMHPLVHAWARDTQSPEVRKKSWLDTGSLLVTAQAFVPSRTMLIWQGFEYLPSCFSTSSLRSYMSVGVKTALSYGHESIVWPILLACAWTIVAHGVRSEIHNFSKELCESWPSGIEDPMLSVQRALHLERQSPYGRQSTLGHAPDLTTALYPAHEPADHLSVGSIEWWESIAYRVRYFLSQRTVLEESEAHLKTFAKENDIALLTVQRLLLEALEAGTTATEPPELDEEWMALYKHLDKDRTLVLSDNFPPYLAYGFLIWFSKWSVLHS
jgi:hypothetical protein